MGGRGSGTAGADRELCFWAGRAAAGAVPLEAAAARRGGAYGACWFRSGAVATAFPVAQGHSCAIPGYGFGW
ncbi:protein of unknown function [Streptomyces sp. KY75]|nr:protein of unknown function [Streptomyces sp. KY70]CAD5992331.1 protein of unknown function [Streptomyces sp. KY75]